VSKEKDTDEPTSKRKPSYLNFDKASYAWSADIDYQRDPEKYRVGKGELLSLKRVARQSMKGSAWLGCCVFFEISDLTARGSSGCCLYISFDFGKKEYKFDFFPG
jgi:hypothetical protein